MKINYLDTYVKIVEKGSISLVAQEQNFTQSAVSQQVKAIEKHFGTKLLERTYKGVVPTAQGEIVYEQALKIVQAYRDITEKLQAVANEGNHLKISATPVASAYALPCTFFHFKTAYPKCILEIESANSDLVQERVLSGQCDMGVLLGKSTDKRLHCKKVFTDEVVLVAGVQLDIPTKITAQQLQKYALLTLAKNQRTQQQIENQLALQGVDTAQLNVLYSLDSIESLKISAVNGYGLAFLPYMSIKKELYHKQLFLVQCDAIHIELEYFAIMQESKGATYSENEKLMRYIEKIVADTIC